MMKNSAKSSRRAGKNGEKEGNFERPTLRGKIKNPKIITAKDYDYFRRQAVYQSRKETEALLEEAEKRKEALISSSMLRKEEIRKLDMNKVERKGGKLSEIEAEAKKRAMHLLERAYNIQLEQEEEIQKCNRLILQAKCCAIRDAQLAERKLMKKEEIEEEKRLNDMMENERRWAIKDKIEKEREETEKRREFAEMLKEQIHKNEEHRILAFNRAQEEGRLAKLGYRHWQEEENRKMREKQEENERTQKELAEYNEQLKHVRRMELEENKIVDMRIQEYQRLKDEREAMAEEEQRKAKMKKDREKINITAQREQARNLQERIDEMNAMRIEEEVEREWREKEKEKALKKAEMKKMLMISREEQVDNKRLMQAIEIKREEEEFMKILAVQKQNLNSDQGEVEKKQRKSLMYRSEILKQINEKERERIQARQKILVEGLIIRDNAEKRKSKLKDAIERKCEEMRSSQVPKVYIDEVKRIIKDIQ